MSDYTNIRHGFNTINGNVYRLNLRQLTAQSFGMSGISLYRLPASTGIGSAQPPTDYNVAIFEAQPMASGLLGLPVYSTLHFPAGKGYKALTLLEPIIEISAEKNIIKTAIQGRIGTVKEFISEGDFVISVKCIINEAKEVDEAIRRYLPPYQELSKYYDLFQQSIALPVECKLLQIFGINNVVVTNYNITESGMVNVKNCSINLISDIAPEIQITKNV